MARPVHLAGRGGRKPYGRHGCAALENLARQHQPVMTTREYVGNMHAQSSASRGTWPNDAAQQGNTGVRRVAAKARNPHLPECHRKQPRPCTHTCSAPPTPPRDRRPYIPPLAMDRHLTIGGRTRGIKRMVRSWGCRAQVSDASGKKPAHLG